jgi:hypothetical protein
MKTKGTILSLTIVFTLIAAVIVSGCAQPSTGKAPIVIGYVGNVASPGTKPCMDMQQMAVEEINAAGGILGRPTARARHRYQWQAYKEWSWGTRRHSTL